MVQCCSISPRLQRRKSPQDKLHVSIILFSANMHAAHLPRERPIVARQGRHGRSKQITRYTEKHIMITPAAHRRYGLFMHDRFGFLFILGSTRWQHGMNG